MPVDANDHHGKSNKKEKKTKNKLLAIAKSNCLNKIGKEECEEDLPTKPEIVEQLQVLGWKESEVTKALISSKPSMIKTVYRLIYEHETVPTELIYSRAIEYKDEIELEGSDSSKRRSMSTSANPLKTRRFLKNSAPARAVTAPHADPAGTASCIKTAESNSEATDLDIRKARRTFSDRSRQVVRVRVRSGSIGANNAQTSVPIPTATPFSGSIREEFTDSTLPALINAV